MNSSNDSKSNILNSDEDGELEDAIAEFSMEEDKSQVDMFSDDNVVIDEAIAEFSMEEDKSQVDMFSDDNVIDEAIAEFAEELSNVESMQGESIAHTKEEEMNKPDELKIELSGVDATSEFVKEKERNHIEKLSNDDAMLDEPIAHIKKKEMEELNSELPGVGVTFRFVKKEETDHIDNLSNIDAISHFDDISEFVKKEETETIDKFSDSDDISEFVKKEEAETIDKFSDFDDISEFVKEEEIEHINKLSEKLYQQENSASIGIIQGSDTTEMFKSNIHVNNRTNEITSGEAIEKNISTSKKHKFEPSENEFSSKRLKENDVCDVITNSLDVLNVCNVMNDNHVKELIAGVKDQLLQAVNDVDKVTQLILCNDDKKIEVIKKVKKFCPKRKCKRCPRKEKKFCLSKRKCKRCPKKVPVKPQPISQHRERKSNDCQADFLKICSTAIQANNQQLTEYEAFGIIISKKLMKMEPSQAIYAESLISGIIRQGLLNKLTKDTDFCKNGCNVRNMNTSL